VPVREESLERRVEGVVVAGYRIGPVTYILYNRGGLTRLKVEEPHVDEENIKEILVGLKAPETPEER